MGSPPAVAVSSEALDGYLEETALSTYMEGRLAEYLPRARKVVWTYPPDVFWMVHSMVPLLPMMWPGRSWVLTSVLLTRLVCHSLSIANGRRSWRNGSTS